MTATDDEHCPPSHPFLTAIACPNPHARVGLPLPERAVRPFAVPPLVIRQTRDTGGGEEMVSANQSIYATARPLTWSLTFVPAKRASSAGATSGREVRAASSPNENKRGDT